MRSIAVFLLMVVATATASAQGQEGTYEGVYHLYFEVSNFTPKTEAGNWWLLGKLPCLDQYVEKDPDLLNIPPIYLKVEGTLSPNGHYGHLNSYSRQLKVRKVIECRVATPEESKF